MRRYVYRDTPPYDQLARVEEAEPVCGKDFCDTCGDCLHCDGEGTCYHSKDGRHFWVVYEKPDVSNVPPSEVSE